MMKDIRKRQPTVKKKLVNLGLLILMTVVISGCGKQKTPNDHLGDIVIPDGTKIIGFGEATHGNSELQILKKDLFEQIMNSYGTKVFVLEGDFGGCLKVNEYIQGGEGNAKDAVAEIGFAIYRTVEMEQLVDWMREYNQTVNEKDKILFYGCDMQRFDNTKEILQDYLSNANEELYKSSKYNLDSVTNDTMYQIDADTYVELSTKMDTLIANMDVKMKELVEKTSVEQFEIARECAVLLKQECDLRAASGNQYSKIRDGFMAENTLWVMEREAKKGNDSIFLSGHNGHIEKCSSNVAGYISLGNLLADELKTGYFAIGTDVLNDTFLSYCDSKDERVEFTVTNENFFTEKCSKNKDNMMYMDLKFFAEENDADREMKIPMLNIGDSFEKLYLLSSKFYTITMNPFESYDGLILLKNATPTKIFE